MLIPKKSVGYWAIALLISMGVYGCRPVAAPVASPSPSPTIDPSPMATVTIYNANGECDRYVPEAVQVPIGEEMTTAVGKIIDLQKFTDFKLTGYRVNVESGVATVDIRVAPDSVRQVVSLSSCEQFSLFGSITETLTKNPQWNVKSVVFTNQGEEIAF
jgi:hypothetical protein